MIDFIWLANLFITFCTAALRDGQLEKNFKIIAKRYLQGIFVFDFISLLPPIVIRMAIQNTEWDQSIRNSMF